MSDVPGVAVDGVSVRFGGVLALDAVSIRADLARVTGLIGPNGAGKTTLFNVCGGTVRPLGGRVELLGEDVANMSPAARARRGLGRTFQRMRLFDSATVRDNVELGREAAMAGRSVLGHLRASRAERAAVAADAGDAMALCGLVGIADRVVGSLPTGQRRLVELARVLAGRFRVLLLDEPSSGLSPTESAEFAGIVRRAVGERGVAVLLVEHDVELVMDLSSHVYVLDFGKLVFEGSPAEVRDSDVVRAAYFGAATPHGARTDARS